MKQVVTLFLGSALLLLVMIPQVSGQQFDFTRLSDKAARFSVVIDMKIEFSFGVHTNEQADRYLGTIVTPDGMVIFNGTTLSSEGALSSFTGFNVKTTPVEIEVTTMEGMTYEAEYIGVDRFTKIGFLKIINPDDIPFEHVSFVDKNEFTIGRWTALYYLLPEFVTPPLAADIGLVSQNLETPEPFPLLVGYNMTQLVSVLFNEQLEPIGVLGRLNDPGGANFDANGMLESFNQLSMPLLGIVTADKIQKLIENPPVKGKIDRGWLGITLQALTPEMADFWGLSLDGGIIVNNIVGDSPAENGGLIVSDIIHKVNGQAVEVDKEDKIPIFQRMIAEMGPDAKVEFDIYRPNENGFEELRKIVTLKEAPIAATDAPEYENEALEFSVRNLVFADYLIFQQDPEQFNGVVVSSFKQGGLAEIEGLQLGDVIQRIGEVEITTIEDVESAMKQVESEKQEEIIFFVWRDNKTLFVNVKTDW